MELKRFFLVFVPLAIAIFAIAVLASVSQSAAVFAAAASDDVGLPPTQPVVGSIIAPEPVARVNDPLDLSLYFTIPNASQLNYAALDWGDGSTNDCLTDGTACTIDPVVVGAPLEVYKVSGSHAFTDPQIYAPQFTLVDNNGQFATSIYEFLVIYDPDGGFVTGGGWIDSPADAYNPDPTLIGKATFGFFSKYKKGADTPSGNTEFQFQVADLNFHSSSYEWLVVTGSNYARFKGAGTINGTGDYKFMLWAGDGEPDTFRIKIWEEDESGVETAIYDNGFNQPIGGGAIVVHAPKGGSQ
jgi:hypothetical protein